MKKEKKENKVIERIREIKDKEGYTNETLSVATKISLETINSMFSKNTSPSIETLVGVKRAFPLYSLDWIITGTDHVAENMYAPNYNPNLLQHFTTADGLIGILSDMKIRFSKQTESNDIKERLLLYHDEVKFGKISKEEANKYKWISFFEKDEDRSVRQPKMFDSYADSHKGGCIEFKKDKLIEKNSFLNEKNNFAIVKYDHYALKQHESIRVELEHKQYSWSNENEHRIIYNGDMDSVNFDFDCIENIYLGCIFFEDIIKVGRLCEVIELRNIPFKLFSQVNVEGIGYLYETTNQIDNSELRAPKLTKYLSDKYLEKNSVGRVNDYKKIYYKD